MKFLFGFLNRKKSAPAEAAPAPEVDAPVQDAAPEIVMTRSKASAPIDAPAPKAPKSDAEDTAPQAADPASAAAQDTAKADTDDTLAGDGQSTTAILRDVAEKLKAAPPAPKPDAEVTIAPTRAPGRTRRNKTRLIGFESADKGVVDLFADQDPNAPAPAEAEPIPAAEMLFPVGWVCVVKGPGRGNGFPLVTGLSSIGRGADQIVQLNFGDNAISRSTHAGITYDPDARTFLLGQGGKSNIVRLNGKPVITDQPVTDGDEIKIGDTVLRLKTMCGPDFDWSDTDDTEEDDDVAIA